jgi:hypothetical protein
VTYTPGSDRLVLLAQALLNTAMGTLRPARLPDRRYRSAAAAITQDCAQLTVAMVPNASTPRTPRGQAPTRGAGALPGKGSGPVLPLLAWRVQLVQDCAPGVTDGNPPNLPTADALDAFGVEMLTDGGDLWRGLLDAQQDGTLFGDLVSDCSGAEVGQLTPGGYQGGFAWWTVDIALLDLDWRNPT